jgi:hypothetical protein
VKSAAGRTLETDRAVPGVRVRRMRRREGGEGGEGVMAFNEGRDAAVFVVKGREVRLAGFGVEILEGV